jgi:hypothetical protein
MSDQNTTVTESRPVISNTVTSVEQAGSTKPVETTITETTQSTESSSVETKATETQAQGTETVAQAPKPKLVPLSELQKERQRRRELQERLDRVEGKINSFEQEKTGSDLAKKAQAMLDLDEVSARKLASFLSEAVSKPQGKTENTAQRLTEQFVRESTEAAEEHEDWNTYQNSMQQLFQEEFQRSGERAFQRGPEYYYAKAKLQSGNSATDLRQQGKQEMADKINQKNLAVTESAKSGMGKPSPRKRWNRAEIMNLARTNPGEYEAKRHEIHQAFLSGEVD